MSARGLSRFALGAGIIGALVFAPATQAAVAVNDTPTPGSGPTSGGTSVTLPALPDEVFVDVSAGREHSLALGASGMVYAWGKNSNGQLGNGAKDASLSPAPVVMPEGVRFVDVSAGTAYSLALAEDGSAYAWGAGYNGQLGIDSRDDALVPTPVVMPEGVTFTQISGGSTHTTAISQDGLGYSWGTNANGLLGIGDPNVDVHNSFVPIPVNMPEGVKFTEMAAGFVHSTAVGDDGTLYIWGDNGYGQLGIDGASVVAEPTAVPLPDGATVAHVAVGLLYTVALDTDGNVYGWGRNAEKQLGILAEPGDARTPTLADAVPASAGAEIRAGNSFSHVVTPGASATAWGTNAEGLTGAAGTTQAVAATGLELPEGVLPVDVQPNQQFTLVLGSDENVYSWGMNSSGQLGVGSTDSSPDAALVPRPEVTATEVTFDGVPGANLATAADGTLTVDTPEHAAGPVDVVVNWQIAGVAQPPITYAAGFTYVAPGVLPTITDPVAQSVVAGQAAIFSVTATGEPAPTVTWEVSRDGGATWDTVAGLAATTVSEDGLTLSVATSLGYDGLLFRALAGNAVGVAESGSALLTVTEPVVPGGDKPTVPQGPGLANSGSSGPLGGIALAALLLAAGGVLAATALRRRA